MPAVAAAGRAPPVCFWPPPPPLPASAGVPIASLALSWPLAMGTPAGLPYSLSRQRDPRVQRLTCDWCQLGRAVLRPQRRRRRAMAVALRQHPPQHSIAIPHQLLHGQRIRLPALLIVELHEQPAAVDVGLDHVARSPQSATGGGGEDRPPLTASSAFLASRVSCCSAAAACRAPSENIALARLPVGSAIVRAHSQECVDT
eukprot:6210287-Pleurochrysis_carterae.AAC.1